MSEQTILVNPYTNLPVWYHVCCVGDVPDAFNMQTCGEAAYNETYMMSVPPKDLPARDIDNLLLCMTDPAVIFEEVRLQASVGADCSILDPEDFFRDLEPELADELSALLSGDALRSEYGWKIQKNMSAELREALLYGCAGSASLNRWVIKWADEMNESFALRQICDLRLGFWKLMHEIVRGDYPIHADDLYLVDNLVGWLERECRVYSLNDKRNGQNMALICKLWHPSPYAGPGAIAQTQVDILGVTRHTYESR